MRVIVTCGPSFEPIDRVRRLTNFSTGELGVMLANRLHVAGHDVICLKGAGATTCLPVRSDCAVFETNAELLALLENEALRGDVSIVFHCAALCDFAVAQVLDSAGAPAASAKLRSSGELLLRLVPTPKVISAMRALFPRSRIIGWKYEMVGTSENAIEAAVTQIRLNGTDGCVINGAAYGTGFGFCTLRGLARHVADKAALADYLAESFGEGA